MNIDTTINMKSAVRSAVDRASEAIGRKRSRVIVLLMRHLRRDYRAMTRMYVRIRYQARGDGETCRRTHIRIAAGDYEMFQDMRKFFKCSVSLLVACAVETYIDDLVDLILNEEYNDDADNYPSQNYLFAQNKMDDVICWHIYWGIPPRKELRRLMVSS